MTDEHQISIHAPREGGDLDFLGTVLDFIISIHAPREGGDTQTGNSTGYPTNFNPRPPRGGRLYLWPLCLPAWAFQSTPPARGATNRDFKNMDKRVVISIHAPREGGDFCFAIVIRLIKGISIHAPREGGDLKEP